MSKTVFAVVAHPDDIEFQMAGTLFLLKEKGYKIHYMNLGNGCCGTEKYSKEEIIAIRREEGMAAAAYLGAEYHESLCDDLAIFYEQNVLAKLAAIMREVVPEIVLVQSPQDYMEDHQNTARLAATAIFTRSMMNFSTDPPVPPIFQEVAVYHAQPHGNLDPLRQVVSPDFCVDITSVIEKKTNMLAFHASQKTWLDATQGMDSYLISMQELSQAVGMMTPSFRYAEGWRRRLHLGFGNPGFDPLSKALEADIYHLKD